MKKISVLITLFLVAMISGCSGDSPSSSTANVITLKMNGQEITATLTSARLIKSSATNEKLLEIVAENNEYKFAINYFSTYSAEDTIPTGNYVFDENGAVEGYAYVSYKLNGNTYGMHSPVLGNLNITSMSSSTKKVTGTFYQTLSGGGDLGGKPLPNELIIASGVFSDIPYTVVNL